MELTRIPKRKIDRAKIVVGIPRAFLTFRYQTLWQSFFDALKIKTVMSQPTNLETMTKGENKANSEMCLAMKIYLGHVASLEGACDYVLVPRIADFGIRRVMCTTFQALPDLVMNIFRHASFKVLSYNVDSRLKTDEKGAMIAMAESLGFSHSEAKKAYKTAHKASEDAYDRQVEENEKLYKQKGLKIVVAGHSYVTEDRYIGKPIFDYLKDNGIIPIRADLVDRKEALKAAHKASPTLKWELSREIVGSLAMHYKDIDGVILLTVYPCALDSMVNDMIMRKNKMAEIPILQLTLDAQSGTAGLETRLESFIDIITMREEQEDHGEE